MVLDKSGTDDQLLDALRSEISRLKTQLQQSQQQAAAAAQSVAHSGRSMADGITSRFSHAGTAALGASATDRSRQGALAGSAMMADSLDFLQLQQQQQQEQWESELRQLQAEVQRLRRLCKNQVQPAALCRANSCLPTTLVITFFPFLPNLHAVGPAGDAGRDHPAAEEEAQYGLPELAACCDARYSTDADTVSIYPPYKQTNSIYKLSYVLQPCAGPL
jgi:hypothetical protein